jgi:ammonium transporter Rh
MQNRDTTASLVLDWIDRATVAKRRQQDKVNDEWKDRVGLQHATIALAVVQIFLIVMYGITVRNNVLDSDSAAGTGTQGYNMFCGVAIMMFIGFGYLMTFLKWHGLSAVGFTMMVCALGLQWGVLTTGFFDQWYNNYSKWQYLDVTIYSLLDGLYAVSSVLITFGALIGKVTPFQIVIITMIEICLWSLNYVVIASGIFELADVGGTFVDHMFGAYFGLACAWVLGKPSSEPDMGQIPDIFSLIGTLFLWIYWPSFVAGAMGADSPGQEMAIVNTILALTSGTITAFFCSSFFNDKGKFRPVDIQNATLAGGVAIGCVANLSLTPAGALFIGMVASLVSVLGYYYVQPYIEENWLIHDTCGVHNLHAMPSIVGALASIIIALNNADIDKATYDGTKYNSESQWWRQLCGMLVILAYSIGTGLLTGWICKFAAPEFDNVKVKNYHDNEYWETADDYGKSFYTELGLVIDEKTPDGSSSAMDKIQGLDSSSHHGRRKYATQPTTNIAAKVATVDEVGVGV